MDWFIDATQPAAARAMRRQLTDYLRRHATDPDEVWSAELAVEELVSNAVKQAAGPVWVSAEWQEETPVVTVHDLGPGFTLPEGSEPQLPDDELSEGGRGLFLVAHLTSELRAAAKRAGGTRVSARLDVRRAAERSLDPPRHSVQPLPALGEAVPGVGFGKESFLRALVVQLSQALEEQQGPAAAEAAVAQVGADVGGQMELEYRQARDIVGRLTPEQLADCYVRLKHAIDGGFYPIEVSEGRIVLGNRACPFGDVVGHSPALCRMTSSVFGGIAARNTGEATVVLEERIAVGDPECRVVVHLGGHPRSAEHVGHQYLAPADAGAAADQPYGSPVSRS